MLFAVSLLQNAGVVNALPASRDNFTGTEPSASMTGFAIFYLIFILVVLFISGYGAAKLSYAYNIYVGNTTGTATIFSILAFLFSDFYYPMYAFFLNPVGSSIRKNNRLV
jgi:hypothetical protein